MRAVVLAIAFLLAPYVAAAATPVTVYKDPTCDCCAAYAEYLRGHGFEVTVVETEAMDKVHADAGTPAGFEGCHMTMIEGYVVEGHVPMKTIAKLLDERPATTGISLPGMPMGAPGMGGDKEDWLVIYRFGGTDAAPVPYAVE
jgi:hypothetical protein